VLVNVSYEIKDEKTRVREISGLVEAMEYLNIFEATLITKEEEGGGGGGGQKDIYCSALSVWLLSLHTKTSALYRYTV